MELALTTMLMDDNMKANGKLIKNMEKEYLHGQVVQNTMDNI